MKTALATAIFVAFAAGQTFAPTGSQKFEVASIKKSKPGTVALGVQPAPGGRRYVGTALPLRSYLYVAYQVRPEQIVGGPAWVDSEPYDLNAEAEKPSSIEELHIMLQNAMTERFNLKFHHAAKEMAAYVLMVDKDGPKNLTIHPATPGSDFILNEKNDSSLHSKWTARCASLDFFTWRLSPWLERPILNQTGLKGCFDFDLAFTRDPPPGVEDGQLLNGVAVDTSGPTIFQALPAQLGLRLESRKEPVDTLVIDSADRGADE
ncbi:MAG TPA: TIGR03435 family protein [Bryobacteraceae bacterium]|jgi:uncharacterized protein (TIGR03435 family)|nr:TIGR03435 family protein [Bryobacteraceae bacterium]